jgi:Tol biopolymer transport system component
MVHQPESPATPRRHLHGIRQGRCRLPDPGAHHAGRHHPHHSALTGTLRVAALLVGFLALARQARAQFFEFGENKIQYRAFDWRTLRGPHVDLYYYPEEATLAASALQWAEASYDTLALRFGHEVATRIPLVIYASHIDFEQTNILPFVPPEGLLGATDFMKRRVTMPFRGNLAEFRNTLRHEMVHVFQFSMISEAYHRAPRAPQFNAPLWWTEGLAEYWSGGQDARDEMMLRDLTYSGRLPTFDQLRYYTGFLVYPLGGRIHQWLADTYGAWRVSLLYRELNRYASFDDALRGIYGKSSDELSEAFQYYMRQQYYPMAATHAPPALLGREIAELAIKPALRALSPEGDSAPEAFYTSPATGYMTVYRRRLDTLGPQREVVAAGKSEGLESMHPFDSRVDANRPGYLLFSARYHDRDALVVWDLTRRRLAGRYQFPGIVSILSPAWMPDGQAIVFSGLADNGMSDLYRVSVPGGTLTHLTDDRYQDLDPAPDATGRRLVFASDRTADGETGAVNLFLLDLESGAMRQLTAGRWVDETPAWGADGRIYFTSSRGDVLNIWSMDTLGHGRRESSAWSGAFDAVPLPNGGLVAGSFQHGSFNIYRLAPDSTAETDTFALAPHAAAGQWTWDAPTEVATTDTTTERYDRRMTLDFATGGVSVAPGYGGVQGAAFLLSDLLNDHLLYGSIGSFQSQELGSFFENLNGSLVYVNQRHRINWGVGAYRFAGRVFEGDLFASYEERSEGVLGILRYPLSRYSRVEGTVTMEHSNRFDFDLPTVDDPRREGWIGSNYISYVHDNSLWVPTGPIDGFRLAVTAGVASDFSNARFDNYLLSGDVRRYVRLGRRVTYATRLFGFWSGGDRPRRINIGGTTGMRGYPNFGHIIGAKTWMVNQELRFPLLNRLVLGTPAGDIVFPEFQGALFVDLGQAWLVDRDDRPMLGSLGGSVRLALAPLVVVRMDAGMRFGANDRLGYGLSPKQRDRGFFQVFFGYNY